MACMSNEPSCAQPLRKAAPSSASAAPMAGPASLAAAHMVSVMSLLIMTTSSDGRGARLSPSMFQRVDDRLELTGDWLYYLNLSV